MQLSRIINGHVIDIVKTLLANWFHVIMTSPPYWQLRDYKTPHQIWPAMSYIPMAGLPAIELPRWKGELGQEPSITMFIGHLIYCFREMKRVLRDDGTLWVNLGDSYIGNGCQTVSNRPVKQNNRGKKDLHLVSKNKAGIPWRFALAMQADGWIWRDEIIWHKKSPMPGSQIDRTTVAHEIVLMFSKSRHYFYDRHAIQEPTTGNAHDRGSGNTPKSAMSEKGTKNNDSFSKSVKDIAITRNPRSVWTLSSEPSSELHFATWPTKLVKRMIKASTSDKGCCGKCGEPYEKILTRKRIPTRPGTNSKLKKVAGWASGSGRHDTKEHNTEAGRLKKDSPYEDHHGDVVGNRDPQRHTTVMKFKGWHPLRCACYDKIVPCRILEPFGGVATTALVAERLHRECTSIEISPTYAERGESRLEEKRREELGMFYRRDQ